MGHGHDVRLEAQEARRVLVLAARRKLRDVRLVHRDAALAQRRLEHAAVIHNLEFKVIRLKKEGVRGGETFWGGGGEGKGARRACETLSSGNMKSMFHCGLDASSQISVVPSSPPHRTWQRQLGSRVVAVSLYDSMAVNALFRSPSWTVMPRARNTRTNTHASVSAFCSRDIRDDEDGMPRRSTSGPHIHPMEGWAAFCQQR